MGVYICSLVVRMTPIKRNSRLHPIVLRLENQPVVLDENQNINKDYIMMTVKRVAKNKDLNRYHITFSLSNVKFSTNCYWSN
jgi:hypothetical protein